MSQVAYPHAATLKRPLRPGPGNPRCASVRGWHRGFGQRACRGRRRPGWCCWSPPTCRRRVSLIQRPGGTTSCHSGPFSVTGTAFGSRMSTAWTGSQYSRCGFTGVVSCPGAHTASVRSAQREAGSRPMPPIPLLDQGWSLAGRLGCDQIQRPELIVRPQRPSWTTTPSSLASALRSVGFGSRRPR